VAAADEAPRYKPSTGICFLGGKARNSCNLVQGVVRGSLPFRTDLQAPISSGSGRIRGRRHRWVTPQNRASYYTAAGVLSDQTQSSVPTA
jgi:hypothetical protein